MSIDSRILRFRLCRLFGIALTLHWLVSCQSASPVSESRPGAYDGMEWIQGGDQAAFAALEEEIARADFEFHLDDEDRLLPAGRSTGPPLVLAPSRSSIIEGQGRFQGFVVVQLHKLAQIDDVEDRVARINEFFFGHGAGRVLVTGFRGFGRSIYADRMKKPPQKN